MKTKVLILLTALFFIQASCKKQRQRPTGNHTLSCYIDGKLFVPRGNPNITTSPSDDGYTFYKWDSNTTVIAKDYRKYTVFFNTTNRNIGIVNLSKSSGSFLDYNRNHAIIRKNGVLYLSKENSGTITFIESSADNVKGTFEFTLYNENDDNA